MITPPEPAALILLRDAMSLRAHVERMYPVLTHSDAWRAMLDAVQLAQESLQREYERKKEELNVKRAP